MAWAVETTVDVAVAVAETDAAEVAVAVGDLGMDAAACWLVGRAAAEGRLEAWRTVYYPA